MTTELSPANGSLPTSNPNHAWFGKARLGIFVHWGLYTLYMKTGHEPGGWHLFRDPAFLAQYNRLMDELNPKGSPAIWADQAVKLGARYMVFTTRHHEGFAHFDTKFSDFNSTRTPAKRDFVAEYVEACRSRGMKVGLYFSSMSWQFLASFTGPFADPKGWEAMVQQTHAQLEELMTNYGKIDLLWYDGTMVPSMSDTEMMSKYWRSHELNAMIRRHQPDILINDRSGPVEDFDTPEQEVVPSPRGRFWEACMTLNDSWGYRECDKNYKSPAEILAQLVHCVQFGGNLLLNISPKPDASLSPESTALLDTLAHWLERNGDSIFETDRTDFSEAIHAAGIATTGGKKAYFHFFGDVPERIRLAGLAPLITGVRRLADGLDCQAAPAGGANLDVTLPPNEDKKMPLVIAIDLDTPVEKIPPSQVLRVESRQTFTSLGPVLAVDMGRHKPDLAPIIPSSQIASLASDSLTWVEGKSFCPGWTDPRVAVGSAIKFDLEIPYSGLFDLEIGLVAETLGEIEITVGASNEAHRIALPVAGYPWTARISKLLLAQGRTAVSVRLLPGARLGFYAYRLQPIWQPLPSEMWLTSGPYPTQYQGRGEEATVREALTTVQPPEASAFSLKARAGDGLWSEDMVRRGQYSDVGINFPFRCGSEKAGVCYGLIYIHSPADQLCRVLIGSDWWLNAYLNGKQLIGARPRAKVESDGAEINGWKPSPLDLSLKAGVNTLLLKSHPGSAAHWLTCRICDPGNLTFSRTP